jgi:hypothetical protein
LSLITKTTHGARYDLSAASKKDADDKVQVEAEEAAQAIAAVNELMAREAAATTPLVILDE